MDSLNFSTQSSLQKYANVIFFSDLDKKDNGHASKQQHWLFVIFCSVNMQKLVNVV